MGKVKLRFIVSNISSNWQKKIGSQRDWVWRGWQTRYTYVRCQSNYETREGQNLQNPPILLYMVLVLPLAIGDKISMY